MNEEKLAESRKLKKVNEAKLAKSQKKNLLKAEKATLQYYALYGKSDLSGYDVENSQVMGKKNSCMYFDALAEHHGANPESLLDLEAGSACGRLLNNTNNKLTPEVLKKIAADFSAEHDK